MNDEEIESMRKRIKVLGTLYAVLFFASLVVIVYQAVNKDFRGTSSVALWALLLGGAVAVRLYRNSLVNKNNGEIAVRRGGGPPSLR